MANVVFAWELGTGYGHLGPFRPIAERLIDAGHSVTVIVKDLARTSNAFQGLPVAVFQAPVKLERAAKYDPAPSTYCHLLQNMGFGEFSELSTMIQAWRNLFRAIQPDCMVFDHCPTGLVAARGMAIPQFTIGSGFLCPVDEFPLREMAPWRPIKLEDRAENELKLVAGINDILKSNRQPTIDRVGEIYSSATENLLTTFQELDHFPHRSQHEYLGIWTDSGMVRNNRLEDAMWPKGTGLRVFAYLNPSKSIVPLLNWLKGQDHRVLVVGHDLNVERLRKDLQPNIRLVSHHLNLRSIRKSCDLAITNGNHCTSCEFLLNGCQLLLLPRTLEQALFSRRVVELGAGLDASPDQPRQAIHQASAMSATDRYRLGAEAFSQTYQSFQPESALEKCLHKIMRTL